jgi:hypothetical protein
MQRESPEQQQQQQQHKEIDHYLSVLADQITKVSELHSKFLSRVETSLKVTKRFDIENDKTTYNEPNEKRIDETRARTF